MKVEAFVGFVLVVLFLFSVFPISVYSGAAGSCGGLGVSAAQSSSDPVDWWSMFRHDLNHTGQSASTGPATNNTAWSYATGGYVFSSPAVVDGAVYVGSDDNNVYCLNASTGTLVWKYLTDGAVSSSPAVAGGMVYVGSGDGNVYCLNASNGALVWSHLTGGAVSSSPAVDNGAVFVGSDDNNMYCLNASNGALVWSFAEGGYADSSPAVVGGLVYVGSEDGNVYCLNASSGVMVWNYTTSSPVFSSPAVAGGMVYVVCEDNRVGCLNASTGTLVWNYTVGGWALSSPAVASGCVYAGSEDGYVCCLDASSGALLWSYMAGGQVDCAPAVASGMVYVGSDDGNVYCLEGSTGTLMWSYLTGGAVFSSPAVADGMLYVGSEDGSVYCFGPSQTYVYGVVVCADCYPGDSAVSVPITMDGLPTSHDTPYTFTGLTGTHTFTVPSADADNDSFLDWGNGERNATITVSSGGVYAANYVASGVTVLPVPFRFQDKDYYCGPACLQMVFGYFGRSVLQSEIASVARTVGFPVYGTNDDELRRAAQFSSESTSMGNQLSYNITGYASQPLGCSAFEEYGMNLTVLESFLDQGKPLILMMWYSSSHHDGHFRVAVGYNQTDVFLQDPYNKPLWGSRYGGPVTAFNISQFMDLWSYDDNWALYVVPWNVTFSVPTHVSLGTPFQVQSTVTYPQPLPGAVSTYAASACNASITLPSGLYLVSGDTQTKTLGTGVMQAGSSQSVTWRLIANSSVTGTVSITAEGVISGSVTVYYSYPAYDYSDLIGATSNFAINLSAIHDVAVTEVSSYKSVLCQGYTENVTVIAANLGDYAETFSVTLYANATSIGNITVSNLPSGTSVPIVFVWNAGGFAYGNCTLSAYAWPVPGETNTANNNCTSGWVMVSLAGDVTGPNGWPDGTVDKQDIGAIVKLFGVKYPDPRYNPNFDINGDGRIDMKDVGIAARNFGAHVQPVP